MLNSPRISALQPPPPPRAPTGAVALARKAAGQVGGWVQRKNAIDERKLRGQPGLGGLLVIVFETEWECRIQRMKGVLRGSKGSQAVVSSRRLGLFFSSSGQISTRPEYIKAYNQPQNTERKPHPSQPHMLNHTSHRFSVQKRRQKRRHNRFVVVVIARP
jgi:hypothetical protein